MSQLNTDCKLQLLRVAELQSDDYHKDRRLFLACRDDRETFCHNVRAGSGNVYKCLFQHKFDLKMTNQVSLSLCQSLCLSVCLSVCLLCSVSLASSNTTWRLSMSVYVCLCVSLCVCVWQCRDRLTVRQRLYNADYRVHRGITVSCRRDINFYKCRQWQPQQQQDAGGMSAVLDCLENVTRTGMCNASLCK